MKITRKIKTDFILKEENIKDFQQMIENQSSLGDLISDNENEFFGKASHLITKIFTGNNELNAEIEILDTNYGRLIKDDIDFFEFVPVISSGKLISINAQSKN